MNDIHTTRQVCRPAEKRLEKKIHGIKFCCLHLCKLETCTYISLAAMYGLTAITKILVAGWKHASFLCYSMGACWFLRFLGPKLELPRSSAYSPYLTYLGCRIYLCVYRVSYGRHSSRQTHRLPATHPLALALAGDERFLGVALRHPPPAVARVGGVAIAVRIVVVDVAGGRLKRQRVNSDGVVIDRRLKRQQRRRCYRRTTETATETSSLSADDWNVNRRRRYRRTTETATETSSLSADDWNGNRDVVVIGGRLKRQQRRRRYRRTTETATCQQWWHRYRRTTKTSTDVVVIGGRLKRQRIIPTHGWLKKTRRLMRDSRWHTDSRVTQEDIPTHARRVPCASSSPRLVASSLFVLRPHCPTRRIFRPPGEQVTGLGSIMQTWLRLTNDCTHTHSLWD